MFAHSGWGSKVAVWIGGILVLAGALVLLGYGVYYFSQEFFGAEDVPLAIQVALPAIVVGVVVLVVAVLLERLRGGKGEEFKGVKY